ncbi:UNVERIFIED_CONTAM: hypothetical protein HDU68_009526 [Siphonaria sp. JEL0065]|nr:hypothetical protein HDU68_009526 [Siphonaria sp. JEL0065]
MAPKKRKGKTTPPHQEQQQEQPNAVQSEALFSFDELETSPSDAFFLNSSTTKSYGSEANTALLDLSLSTEDDAVDWDPKAVKSASELFARVPALSNNNTKTEALLDIFADPMPLITQQHSIQSQPLAVNQDLLNVFTPTFHDPNSVTLNIKHNTGTLSISVGDLMSKLDRLEKLQNMFNDLEKTNKKQSRHNARINEILDRQSPLVGGVPLNNEDSLQRLNSFLLDQRLKIEQHVAITESLRQEVAILKEEERLLKVDSVAKSETIKSLQHVVQRQEEEIKDLKKSTPPSRAESPTRRSESLDTAQKYRQSPVVSPALMKPTQTPTTASSSFFNFLPIKSKDKESPSTLTSSTIANQPPSSPMTSDQPPSSPSDAANTFQMKLKIRDLANALKKVTDQRDLAIIRIKELQQQQQQHQYQQQSNGSNHLSFPMGTPRLTSVDELVAVDLDARRNSGDSLSGLLETVGNDLTVGSVNGNINTTTSSNHHHDQTIRARIKDLETLLQETQQKLEDQIETNKKLRTNNTFNNNNNNNIQGGVRKRVSSGHFFEAGTGSPLGSISNVNDSEVSGLESELLEKKEVITALEAQIREIGKSRDEEVEKVFVLETKVSELESAKKLVQEKLDSVDERHAASLDSMAAVHEMSIKTLEEDLENRKRLMKISVEKGNVVAAQVEELSSVKSMLEARVDKLEAEVKALHNANETVVSSLVDSEMMRKKALENVDSLLSKGKETEDELIGVTEKLAATTAAHEAALEEIQIHSGSANAMQEKMEAAHTAQKETLAKLDKAFAIIRKLKTEAETKEVVRQKLEADLDASKAAWKQAESDLETFRAEVEALKAAPPAVAPVAPALLVDGLAPVAEESVESVKKEELEQAAAQNSSLAAQVQELTSLNEKLRVSLADKPTCDHGDVYALHAQIVELTAQQTLSAQESATLQARILDLNDQKLQEIGNVCVLQTRIADLEKELEVARLSVGAADLLRTQIVSLEANLAAASTGSAVETGTLQSRVSQLENELAAAHQSVEDANELRSRLGKMENDLSAAQQSAEDANTLRTRVAVVETELAEAQTAVVDAAALRTRVFTLEAELLARTESTGDAGGSVAQIASLEADLAIAQKALDDQDSLRRQIATLGEELAAARKADPAQNPLYARVTILEKELTASRELAGEATTLTQRINKLQEELRVALASTADLSVLRGSISNLGTELATAQESAGEVTKLQDKIRSLEGELVSVVESAESLREFISSLEKELSVVNASLYEARSHVGTLESELLESKKSSEIVDSLKIRISNLESELVAAQESAADAAAAAVGVTISDPLSSPRPTCKHTNVETLEQTITHLRSQLEAISPKDLSVEKELAACKNDMIDARSRLSALESLKKELENQLETSCTAQKETVAKMDKAYTVVRKMRADADTRIKEMEALKVELSAVKEALKCSEDECTALRVMASSSSEVATLKGRVAEFTVLNESLKAKVVALESMAGDPLSTCTHEDVESLQATVAQLRVQLAEHPTAVFRDVDGNELESIRAELAETCAKLVSIETSKAVLEAQLLSTSADSTGAATATTLASDLLATTISSLELKLVQTTSQLHAAEESLAREKQAIHAHVESLHAKDFELSQTKSKLSEEEEKKNKSIQLLRNMKAKILKLEDMVQSRDAELSGLKEELKELRSNASTGTAERDAKLIALTKQTEDMGARIRKQNDDLFQMEKLLELKNVETDGHAGKMRELKVAHDRAVVERNQFRDLDSQKSGELEATRVTLTLQSAQLTEWHDRVKDLEFRISNLDDELETSKRLFESKSIEYETLQMKLSEVEKQFYETEQTVGNSSDEVDQLRREIVQLRREVAGQSTEGREKESLLESLKQEKQVSESLRVKMERNCDNLTEDVERLKAKLLEFISKEEEWKATVHQLELLKSGKELEINARTLELRTKLEKQDKYVEESKTRENQLLKLNKSLKDEVRKLARSIGITTPTLTSPTLSHHNSGLDEKEIAAANAALGMNQFPASRKSSLGSGLDLSGSSNGLNWGPTVGSVGKPSPAFPSFMPSRNNSMSSPTTPTNALGIQPAPRLAANEEYLKNVVLRFVESKRDTKLQMVPALGMLLRLTPEEVKRVQKCI